MSTGSICITCKLEGSNRVDLCHEDLCWCHQIVDKEKLMDCGKEIELKISVFGGNFGDM